MPEAEKPQHSDEDRGDHAANSENTVSSDEVFAGASVSPNSIEGLFLQALQIETPVDRDAFLQRHCGDDVALRNRVTALLRAYDDAGSFLETPVGGNRETDDISLSFLKPVDREGCLGTLGPYEVLEVIGRGGMGVVLRAVDPKLNRVVAVKVLLPELAANPNSRRRFLREAQAAAAISHPHVVTIHAVDDAHQEHDGKPVPPYLVMEFVAGLSLQQKLDRVGPLRLAEILRISRQIGEGLAAAHQQGLIHRDIKPANILLENGVERVKITDFGLARAIDDITVTRTGEVSGTPQYMSPEQASGERVDHRSDLFSMGCVMYAMCTGHSPFRGDGIAHVIKRVTQDTPRPIADQNSEIPPWLIEIITCLLQKNAEHRFQSADGVVAILDQHLSRIQHPTESGSHSVINQQVPVGSTVETFPATVETPSVQSNENTSSPLHGNRFSPDQIGVVLIGIGAMAIFCVTAWLLLVASDVIGASHVLRENAGAIVGGSMIAAFLLMTAGMLLRKQILGHQTWIDLLSLLICAALGPIGIAYWMVRRSQRPVTDAGSPSLSDEVAVPATSAIIAPLRSGAAQFVSAMVVFTVAGGFFSALILPTQALWNSKNILTDVFKYPASLLGIWILQMLGSMIFRKGRTPIRQWALLSGAAFGCMAVGWFWMTIVRMPTPDNNTVVTPRSLMGGAILPTMIWFMFCVYACRETAVSHGGIQPPSVRRTRTLVGSLLLFGSLAIVITSILFAWYGGGTQPTPAIPIDPVVVAVPAHPVITLKHPDLGKIREVMVNRLQSSLHLRSKTETMIPLDRKLLGTPINIHLILMDGREWVQYGFPLERLQNDIVISEADLDAGNRSLVEVVEDAPGAHLRMVGYPTQHISVNDFNILKAPFHKALPPGEHRIELDYVLDEWDIPAGFVQYNKLDYRVTVTDNKPLKLSLKDIIDHHGAEAKTHRIKWNPDFKPLAKQYTDSESKPDDSRASQHATVASAGENASESQPAAPGGTIIPLQPGPNDRAGQLLVHVVDDGMRVVLRRKSAFGGYLPGYEQQVTTVGWSTLRLHPGDYEIAIQDRHFGWDGQFRTEEQTITDGPLKTLEVARDLNRLPVQTKIQTFRWNRKSYLAESLPQIHTINQLLADPEMPVAVDDILAFIREGLIRAQKQTGRAEADALKSFNGVFYLLPEYIEQGLETDTYRLAPVEQAIVKISLADDGLSTQLTAVDENADVAPRVLSHLYGHHESEDKLPPGDYELVVTDNFANWSLHNKSGFPITVLSQHKQQLHLSRDDVSAHNIKRNLRLLAEFDVSTLNLNGEQTLKFVWGPPPTGLFGGMSHHELTLPQAKCVRRLLQAFVDDSPDVSEDELETINGKPITDLFPGLIRDNGFRNLIIPGTEQNSWQLKPLRDGNAE